MKTSFIKYTAVLGLSLLATTSCKEDFLNQTPQSAITIDNFFQNKEQVLASTAALYGFPWFNFNDKALLAMGDVMGGNIHTYDSQFQPFMLFSVQPANARIAEAWASLYKVIGMSNTLIKLIPEKAAVSINKEDVNAAIGEAKFMRALAYFYLTRLWGPVPIVEDPQLATGDANINRNRPEDVYKLIIKDLQFSEANCQPNKSADGRVSIWSAKALLSKVYLYQKDYTNARAKAEEVINSGQYSLMDDYADCFKQLKNNNAESVFALQWKANADAWGIQNTAQAYLAPYGEGIVETGDGWGSVAPSIDLVGIYQKNDKRKKPSIMTAGDVYPELISKANPKGYTYPATRLISASKTHFRKYIVGAPPANGGTDGDVFFMKTSLNTNILRFAEVYLIAAEAIMGTATSTSDAKAISYYNKVRTRAGIAVAQTITFDDILQERRTELAGEGDYWYDLCRIDRAKAINIISKQERGNYYDLTSNPDSRKITPTAKDFLMPIPQGESDRSPKLLEEPIPYVFK
jgi:starch-binding outer membrane protein, SusD/RagB family